MAEFYQQLTQLFSGYVPNLLGAIAVLVLGWLFALLIAAVVRGILKRTSLDNKLAKWIAGKEKAEDLPVARYVSKTVYYVILLFVLIAFFQTLGLTILTNPLNQLLIQVFAFAPQLFAALILILAAWALATFLRMIISKVLDAAKLDERLGEKSGAEKEDYLPLSKTISNAVYWLIFLLFLPAILDSLKLQGLLGPVQNMLNEILNYLPNIFTAAVILLIGWFAAMIIKKIVSNLFAVVGMDKLSDKVGLTNVIGKNKLSDVLGIVVYVLILIPIIISALEALSLELITNPATNMLDLILTAIPSLFAAALIILVSYIVGKIVANLVSNLLANLGFDRFWLKLGLAKEEFKDKKTASEFAGYLVLVTILLFATIESLRMLNFDNVATILTDFINFAGQVILGLIIFTIGLFVANLVSGKVKESKSRQANLLAIIAKTAILVLVGSMALQQMGFGENIVLIAFGLFFGALAVAAAIAFGVGGRDIAQQQLKEWTEQLK